MRRATHTAGLLAGALALSSCGAATAKQAQPSPLQPTLSEGDTETERAWLKALNEVETSEPTVQNGMALGPIYHAASGKPCRRVQSRDGSQTVLACQGREQWYLVPEVFPPGLSTEEAQP